MEEGEVPAPAEAALDKSALLAALRARIKRARSPSPPEEGEVEWQQPPPPPPPPRPPTPVEVDEEDDCDDERREQDEAWRRDEEDDRAMVIDLDQLSSEDEQTPVKPNALERAEMLSRLQALIEEKEREKKLRQQEREEDVGLLQTKLAAQEGLMLRLNADIIERERAVRDMRKRVQRVIPHRIEELRERVARLNAELAETEGQMTALIREGDEIKSVLLPEAEQRVKEAHTSRLALREKLKQGKTKVAKLLPPPPSGRQIDQAARLHNAFVMAGFAEESTLRCTFGHLWTHEARPVCVRMFRALGIQMQKKVEDDDKLPEPQQKRQATRDGELCSTYESPLVALRSYRLTPAFSALLGQEAVRHVSFSNQVTPGTVLCRFEFNGECKDEQCHFLHVRDYELASDETLLDDLSRYESGNVPARTRAQILQAMQSSDLGRAVSLLSGAKSSLLEGPPRNQRKVVDKVPAMKWEGAEQEEVAEPVVSEVIDDFERPQSLAGDPEVVALVQRDRHNVKRWIELATRHVWRSSTLNHAAGICVLGIEHNPKSAALWLFYIDVLLQVQNYAPDELRVELVFSGATKHLPFCVAIWTMYMDVLKDFASKDRISLRALDEVVAEQVKANGPPPVFHAVLFQLVVLRMRFLRTAGRSGLQVVEDVSKWLSFLGPWQFVNVKLLCMGLEFGAVRLPELSAGLFDSDDATNADYVLLDPPDNCDQALIEKMIMRLLQDDMGAYMMGYDLKSRLPFRVNLIRLRMAQGSRGQAFAHVAELLHACPHHPDVHWLAGQVLLDSSDAVAPLLESKYVFALSRMAGNKGEAPPPPSSSETLSEAEQVCAWLCAALTAPSEALFQEARYCLKVQCSDKAAFCVFWASYMAFVSGRNPTAPFGSVFAQAHGDLMLRPPVLQSTQSSVFELSEREFLASASSRRYWFERVAVVALAPLPPVARRRIVDETPDNDGLILWSVHKDMMSSSLSIESCQESRRMARQLIKRSPTNWDAWHIVTVIDWIGNVDVLITDSLNKVVAALKTFAPVIDSVWIVVVHILEQRKHPQAKALSQMAARLLQNNMFSTSQAQGSAVASGITVVPVQIAASKRSQKRKRAAGNREGKNRPLVNQ